MPEQDSGSKPTPNAPQPGVELSEEMRGALEGVVDDHFNRSGRAGSPAPLPQPIGWVIATVVAWAALAMLLIVPPAIGRPAKDRAFAAPPELRAASLRFGLWLARHRVDAFERTAARLPRHVGEAGVDDRTIILEPNGRRRYTLIARDGSVGLRLTSEMSADSFLGDNHAQLVASRAYQQAGIPGRTVAR